MVKRKMILKAIITKERQLYKKSINEIEKNFSVVFNQITRLILVFSIEKLLNR